MHGFNYSRAEYVRTYRRLLPSTKITTKNLEVLRAGDNTTCNIKLFGYPLRCPEARQDARQEIVRLGTQLRERTPELLAVQLDPLPYLYQQREHAIHNLPNINSLFINEQKGIFQHEEAFAEATDSPMKLSERMHNFLYPVSWQEAQVDIYKLWCLNQVKTKDDMDAVM